MDQSLNNDSLVMTAGRAAKLLGVARTTVISWIRRGLIAGGQSPTGQYMLPSREVMRLFTKMGGLPSPDSKSASTPGTSE